MKKLIIIVLLIVGCMFGDTIKYKKNKPFGVNKNEVLEKVEFLGVSNDGVHYKKSIGFLGNTYGIIKCDDVYTILDNSQL